MMNDNIIFHTFGCKMHTFESNCIKQIISQLNMKNIIIVNTCSITGESERKYRQEIRKL